MAYVCQNYKIYLTSVSNVTKVPHMETSPCRPIGEILPIGKLFVCGENIVFITVYMYVVGIAQSFSSGFRPGSGLVRGGIANDGG